MQHSGVGFPGKFDDATQRFHLGVIRFNRDRRVGSCSGFCVSPAIEEKFGKLIQQKGITRIEFNGAFQIRDRLFIFTLTISYIGSQFEDS
jgi:hypothetical protein